MRITFLGTGTSQGVPVIACSCPTCLSSDPRDNRTRTSVFIEVDGQALVIDTGTDFRHQMLREKVKRLDAVLFTHAHKDHTSGLDDIRPFYFMNKKDMPIYGTVPVIDQLKREFAYIFADYKYPGIPGVEVNLIDKDTPFKIGSTEIIPIEVMHYKLPVLGFRIKDFTYITDANFIAQSEVEKIKGSKILVLNALQHEKHISHFNLKQAIEMAQEIGAEQTYFVHMGHNIGTHVNIAQQTPPNIYFAHDGLQLNI